jgi:hypothetical protein
MCIKHFLSLARYRGKKGLFLKEKLGKKAWVARKNTVSTDTLRGLMGGTLGAEELKSAPNQI